MLLKYPLRKTKHPILPVIGSGESDVCVGYMTNQMLRKQNPERYGVSAHAYEAALGFLGFRTAAMALTDRSVPLDYPPLKEEPRLALMMGTEGDGLPEAAIEGADYVVRIPMAHGVDSLNVAAASAVAFWELRCGENH